MEEQNQIMNNEQNEQMIKKISEQNDYRNISVLEN